jgi:hypothetical protein
MMFDDNPEIRLGDFEFQLRERFLYEYDMYDSWEHDVRLEKILPCDRRIYPQCTGGHRLAPPEDCGSARVYMEEGDPRWRKWWRTMPREGLPLMAETVQRVLDTRNKQPIVEGSGANRDRSRHDGGDAAICTGGRAVQGSSL